MSNEELVKQIQLGINTTGNMDLLYQQNRGIIFKIAKRYAYRDDIEGLLQEAYFGLYEAVKRYKDTAGVLFLSYASYWIKQAITRYLEENGRTVRMPVALQSYIVRFKKIVSAYEMQLGRRPTDSELCRHLGVSNKTLQAIKKAHCNDNIQSLDDLVPGTDDVLFGEGVPDQSCDIENDVIEGMIEKGKRTELWKIVRDNTTPDENDVIIARYIKSMTLEAVGQSLGKNRDAVRTIEARALRKLRYPRIRRVLEEKFEINYARAYWGSLGSFNNTWNSIVEDIAIRNLDIVNSI